MFVTATVLATGSNSTVPDNDSAVDFRVSVDNVVIGDCTLLVDHTGELETWGSLENWADAALAAWFEAQDERYLAHLRIVRACRSAFADHDFEADPR